MKRGTIKILLLLLCFTGTSMLKGQVVDEPVVPQVSAPYADTLTVTGHLLKQIKAAPVPDINGPQDIHLDRTESLRFLERFSGSNNIWRRTNDPLREALKNLVWMASRPPEDTVLSFLSQYPFERIRIPAEKYYVFDSVRIILPVMAPETVPADSTGVAAKADEMFIRAGTKLEKVRLTPDSRPILRNDTLKLNDSVYILMRDFIPASMPHATNDTIVLVITDTLPEVSLARTDFPFRYLRNPYVSDSLEAAVSSLISYLEARDSSVIRLASENGRGSDVWLNSQSDNLVRFWLPDGEGDSVTVWIGSPLRNTLSLRAEEGVMFRKQIWHDKYVDTRVNVTTAQEENLRRVALSKIKPDLWKFKTDLSYLLSQGVISNWAKGGESNISSVLDVTSALNYNNKVTKVNSATSARFALGLQASGKYGGIRKNLDILEINSKINHKAFGKFDLSGIFQFKSQFLPGYTYPNDTTSVMVSKFFNPATFILGYGLEYKPNKNLSVSFSPLSYKGTIVTDTANINQTKYGIAADKMAKNELGAYLTVNSKLVLFEKINMTNRIQLFSNFLMKPQNVDVDWEMIATMPLNWFTDLRVNTHLIYDDNTLLPVFEKGEPVLGTDGKQKKAPMVQFKELLGVSFVFKF
ncbi:MAG: DUF3078 domain-containing protein [Bacteroidales bacterium]|jgi:hypothetical protein|nr:DUF3078 domain-containing protein [Bacteroidales bacterium]